MRIISLQEISMATFANQLNGTCWTAKIGDMIMTYSFALEPTLFENGGTFKLHFMADGLMRDQDVLYAFRDGYLVMESIWDRTRWICTYNGGLLTWTSPQGASMTWEKSKCDSNRRWYQN